MSTARSEHDPRDAHERPVSVGGFVVLGLLLDGPSTGWELAQVAERSIAHFWPITRAHIYAELPKLARRGFVTAVEVAQSAAPTKRVFTATEDGRQAFVRWLDEVELTEERGRQPLQLQLFFAAHGHSDRLRHLLDTWQAQAQSAETHCAAILAAKGVHVHALPRLALHPPQDAPDREQPGRPLQGLDLRGMTALFGLRRAQADLAWLDEVRGSLDGADPHP